MRTHLSKKSVVNKRTRRKSLATIIIVAVVLTIGAVTVVSRQKFPSDKVQKQTQLTQTPETYPSLHNEAGNQTSQTARLSAVDADRLATGIGPMVKPYSEGLLAVHHGDGSVSINLEDRYQNVTVVRVNENGSLTQSCVDNPQAAGAFFGIDPSLIERKSRARIAPVRKD